MQTQLCAGHTPQDIHEASGGRDHETEDERLATALLEDAAFFERYLGELNTCLFAFLHIHNCQLLEVISYPSRQL